MEALLRSVINVAADKIPFWVFQMCSFELAEVVAHIFKFIFPRSSSCPMACWYSYTHPQRLKTCFACRLPPYFSYPFLSRPEEKLVVNNWIRPTLTPEIMKDRDAFRPTGITTCFLLYCILKVTEYLDNNFSLRVICVDFSKALTWLSTLYDSPKLSPSNFLAILLIESFRFIRS